MARKVAALLNNVMLFLFDVTISYTIAHLVGSMIEQNKLYFVKQIFLSGMFFFFLFFFVFFILYNIYRG